MDNNTTIYEERLESALGMVKRISEKFNLKLSDYEKMDIATRIAASLFIRQGRKPDYKQNR